MSPPQEGDAAIRARLLEELVARESARRPFEAVRADVAAALRARRAQQALRERLERLRAEVEVDLDAAALRDDALWSEEPPEAQARARGRAGRSG